MAELSEWVIAGELCCSPWGVQGGFQLEGRTHPIHFDLTGPVKGDWADLHLGFVCARKSDPKTACPPLASQQVGPLGNFFLTPTEDGSRAENQGHQTRLFLEWYGRNGHLLVDLQPLELEFRSGEGGQGRLAAVTDPLAAAADPRFFTKPVLRRIESSRLKLAELEPGNPNPDQMREMIEMDHAIESGMPATSIQELFDPPLRPPDPDSLVDKDLEFEIKVLLAQLGRLQIKLDPCSHLSWRQIYRLLVEEILPAEFVAGFQPFHTVEHFGTWESCPQCQDEDGDF